MGLLSFLTGSKPSPPPALALPVDLGSFKCGQTVLGTRFDRTEPYADCFDRNEIATFTGLELGKAGDLLECAMITLKDFTGTLSMNGSRLSLSTQTTPEEIISLFGSPYWTDTMDEEMILFHEFQDGRIEFQFEFPDRKHLERIILTSVPILSDPDQRKAYHVTREWPPRQN